MIPQMTLVTDLRGGLYLGHGGAFPTISIAAPKGNHSDGNGLNILSALMTPFVAETLRISGGSREHPGASSPQFSMQFPLLHSPSGVFVPESCNLVACDVVEVFITQHMWFLDAQEF